MNLVSTWNSLWPRALTCLRRHYALCQPRKCPALGVQSCQGVLHSWCPCGYVPELNQAATTTFPTRHWVISRRTFFKSDLAVTTVCVGRHLPAALLGPTFLSGLPACLLSRLTCRSNGGTEWQFLQPGPPWVQQKVCRWRKLGVGSSSPGCEDGEEEVRLPWMIMEVVALPGHPLPLEERFSPHSLRSCHN